MPRKTKKTNEQEEIPQREEGEQKESKQEAEIAQMVQTEPELPKAETANAPVPLRTFQVEGHVESGAPAARKLPRVIGGICEFCGVIDSTKPAHLQYTLCEHYTRVGMKCTYCPPESDWADILTHRELQVFEFPVGSGNLVTVCDDIRCRDKHLKRFQTSRT